MLAAILDIIVYIRYNMFDKNIKEVKNYEESKSFKEGGNWRRFDGY